MNFPVLGVAPPIGVFSIVPPDTVILSATLLSANDPDVITEVLRLLISPRTATVSVFAGNVRVSPPAGFC